ncbi:hypothetical protein AAKU55_003882 [Oxalobacteraceae bacterium GrIS 1.11]
MGQAVYAGRRLLVSAAAIGRMMAAWAPLFGVARDWPIRTLNGEK